MTKKRPKPIHIGRITLIFLALILIIGSWTIIQPVTQYGMGAADDNLSAGQLAQFSLTDLFYLITGKHKDSVFPTEYKDPNMAKVPVLNQGNTPQCIAYAASEVANAIDVNDFGFPFSYNTNSFFIAIGGGPNGASMVDAMNYLKSTGYPVNGIGQANLHKSLKYAIVKRSVADIKAAITAYGALAARADWPESWFHPNSQGVLPTPDAIAGGHGIVVFGWSDALGGFWMRNSWGSAWGKGGNALIPYAYATTVVTSYWAVTDSPIAPIDPRATPTPSPTTAPTPTPTIAPTPTPAPTILPTPTPIVTPSVTPGPVPTPTATPSQTIAPTPVPTIVPPPSPIATDPPVILEPSGPTIPPVPRAALLLILGLLAISVLWWTLEIWYRRRLN